MHIYHSFLLVYKIITVTAVSTLLLALVSRLSENNSSYECMLFTTNFFVDNLLKHLGSCQFVD